MTGNVEILGEPIRREPLPGGPPDEDRLTAVLAIRLVEFRDRQFVSDKVLRSEARNVAREIVRNVAAVLREEGE